MIAIRARIFGSKLTPVLAAAAAILLTMAPEALARHRTHIAPPGASGETAEAGASKLASPYTVACVMEPTTGTIIFEKDMHRPWPLASVTKMMLMLIVAEKLNTGAIKLTDPVKTSRKAAKMGGSQVYLAEGEVFSLDDMMKAVVVHSANDAAVAVAEYLAGSTDEFVQMMNQRATDLGLKDTHYYSVHGLPPGPGQQADVSSAYDSAVIARELVKYPDVLRWSAIDTAPFRNGKFELRNTNHLVRDFRGCDGLKTGFYHESGFNVVATAKRNGLRVIAVVFGSPRKHQDFNSAAGLMSQAFLNYQMYPVAKKGGAIAQSVAIAGGGAAKLQPVWGDDLSVFLKRGDEKRALKIQYDLPPSIAAPIAAGQQLGKADVTVDGKTVQSIALVAPEAVPKASPSLLKRLFGSN